VVTSLTTPLLCDLVKPAAVPPNLTAVALVRPAPVMVTAVPAGPRATDSPVTCGVTATEVLGVEMPPTVYAPETTVVTKSQDSLASPLLPQLVPHWLRMNTPSLS